MVTFKERLKGLIGHYVVVQVEMPSGELDTIWGVLEEVNDDTIALRHGCIRKYVTNVTIIYVADCGRC